MSFHVYILKCADDSYYTGHTDQLEMRVAMHTQGKIAGYTSTRLPVKVVYTAEFATRVEALASERQIKGWSRAKKEALMRGDWETISLLAKSRRPIRGSTAFSPELAQGSLRTGDAPPRDSQIITVRPELVEGHQQKEAD